MLSYCSAQSIQSQSDTSGRNNGEPHLNRVCATAKRKTTLRLLLLVILQCIWHGSGACISVSSLKWQFEPRVLHLSEYYH
jgi:hypothetical protein